MIHKLIKTDNYLLVVGNNYKSDKFPYTIAEKLTTGEYQLWQVDNPNDWDEPNQYELLAHLPLNSSPILEGVDLLPPLEDDVIELADEWVFDINGYKWSNNDSTAGDNFGSYIAGYNKAREKYKYTEDDLINAIMMYAKWLTSGVPALRTAQNKDDMFIQIIQSLHQYPTEFECYTTLKNNYYDSMEYEYEEHSVIETTINTQGQRVWVGKYK